MRTHLSSIYTWVILEFCGFGFRRATMRVRIKRAYDPPSSDDGTRVLVDGLWPRGVSKADLKGVWLKELAPSAQLRKWFNHDSEKWEEFKSRYFAELSQNKEVAELKKLIKQGSVTLLYGSREERFNNAAALKEYMESVHR
jgi:uncharacterized protein YeaO (DUF488 family)